jgi:hypothetical protein
MRLAMLAAIVGVSWLSHATAAEPVRSIEHFNQLKSKWPDFVDSRTLLKLEGRCSAISKNTLRFQHCDLSFRSSRRKGFPKLIGSGNTIDVLGHLIDDDGKLVFMVDRFHQRPSDLATFRSKARLLSKDDVQQWSALAQWAKGRAAFYHDKKLHEQAETASLQGILIERRQLLSGKPAGLIAKTDGLFALAQKVARLKLSQALRFELIHEAYRLLWESAQKEEQPKLQKLANRLADDLPGCATPLQLPQPKLRKKYQDDSLSVYRAANEAGRRKLHRIFYSEIVLRMILKQTEPDGSNGFEIAGKIEKQLPEQHALAESHRDRELAFKLSRVTLLTRQEMLTLSEQFRLRKQPQKEQQTRKAWVADKTKQLRDDGPAGLIDAAEMHQELLNDLQSATSLLLEARKQNPDSQEISEQIDRRLHQLGYSFKNGELLSNAEAEALRRASLRQAGRTNVGMTAEQIRKAIGSPTSITRIATSGRMNEVWSYGARETTRLIIHFQRHARRGAQSTVVRITQIKPR